MLLVFNIRRCFCRDRKSFYISRNIHGYMVPALDNFGSAAFSVSVYKVVIQKDKKGSKAFILLRVGYARTFSAEYSFFDLGLYASQAAGHELYPLS